MAIFGDLAHLLTGDFGYLVKEREIPVRRIVSELLVISTERVCTFAERQAFMPSQFDSIAFSSRLTTQRGMATCTNLRRTSDRVSLRFSFFYMLAP